MAAMAIDKKVIAGEIRLVLLNGIGDAEVTADYSAGELRAQVAQQLAR
jgi:3-dehydroquinate synthetase